MVRAIACVPVSIPGPRDVWVEFVVGSLPCCERFSPETPVFHSSQKPIFPNSKSELLLLSSTLP